MEILVGLAKLIFGRTFHRKHEVHAKVRQRPRRFRMESLETRVLLSADPVVLPDWMESPETTNGTEYIQAVTSDEPTGARSAIMQALEEGGAEEEVIVLIDDIFQDEEI